ncbi:MAG TPA: rod shape-determining protein MreD [Gammaproteobacteria bacterium]|nr:rod shape-determining protein MreD [Gammaproteobacteria bacterium]
MSANIARHHGGPTLLLTFVAALLLQMLPLPDWAQTLRPDWVALVLIYWCIALPERVGVGVGWIAGLMLDVAHGTLLGQNALALAIVAYLALRLHQRIRLFPMWQQAVSVLLLVALHLMLVLWIKGATGQSAETWAYWLPALTSMLVWPLLFIVLRGLRRTYRVR